MKPVPFKRAFQHYFIKRAFRRYFRIVAADSPPLRDEVFRIRYAVYCEELGYENKDEFPDGKERDTYDDYSRHCLLLHRPSNRYVGCVRLVLPAPDDPQSPFPFERVCEGGLYTDIVDPRTLQRERFGEISRLAVVSRFRRRSGEYQSPRALGSEAPDRQRRADRRVTPHVALCLSLAAAATGIACGLTGVFALMEPRLNKRLESFGIRFQQVGDPVEHRGLRTPFFITRDDLYAGLPLVGRALLEAIQEDLSGGKGAPERTDRGAA